MKHFILFALMVVSLAGYSQSWRGNNVDARISMYGPVRDTAFWTPYRNGAFLISPIDGQFYYWWNGQWRKPGASIAATNGLSLTGANIMLGVDSGLTTNPFTGSRQVNLGGYNLLFNGKVGVVDQLTINGSALNSESGILFKVPFSGDPEFFVNNRLNIKTGNGYQYPEYYMNFDIGYTNSGYNFTGNGGTARFAMMHSNYRAGGWPGTAFYSDVWIEEKTLIVNRETGGFASFVIDLPGTTAQRRSTAGAGIFRYNTTLNRIDLHNGTSWQNLAYTSDLTNFVTSAALTDSLNKKDTLETFVRNDSLFIRFKLNGGGTVETFQFRLSTSLANNSISRTKLNNQRLQWDIFEEFLSSGFGGNFAASQANSGGAFVVASSNASRIGEAQVQTSSSANARAAITTTENIIFNSNTYTFEVDDLLLNSLNNASDSIYLYIGFFDNAGNDNTPTDGAYIRYDAGSTAWQICTRNNGVETRQTTSSTVAASTAYRLTCSVSSSGASFFVNGTQIGTTITTNIPFEVGRDVAMGVKIMKRGGTGLRSVNFDRFKFRINE